MKKVIISLCFYLMAAFLPLQGQHFQPGTLNLNVGTSAWHIGTFHMPVVLSAEYGVWDFLGAGVYAGYGIGIKKDYWPTYGSGEWTFNNLNYHNFMVGAQVTAHIWDLIDGPTWMPQGERFDLQATLYGGARLVSRNVAGNPDAFDFPLKRKGFVGLSVTARYFFTENLAFYLEPGRSPSGYLAFGFTYQLPNLGGAGTTAE